MKPRIWRDYSACLVCVLGFWSSQAMEAATIHVATNGNDALSGASWATAKATVTAGLAGAAAGDAVWVAAGLYTERVVLKNGVALYGGFAGTETSLDQRDWTHRLSILYGNTNGVVVTITNAGPATRLDGMAVTGGLAIHGGGIQLVASGPVIANNRIQGNYTDGAGAGLSIWGCLPITPQTCYVPVITNNIITDNMSINDEGDGGGIAVIGSSPWIVGNLIARNTATRNGGGIACWRDCRALIANNFIEANSASYDETTASVGGGGIFASATDLDGRPIPFAVSAPLLVNNVIAANGARHGGGVAVIDSQIGAATLRNNTVVGNSGSGIFWGNTAPTNDNNLVAFNTIGFERGLAGSLDAVIRFNNVYGHVLLGRSSDYWATPERTGSNGNLSQDPQLAQMRMGDFHLQPDSPCVDAGSTALAEGSPPDIDGQPRAQGVAIDIGADESDGTLWNVAVPIIRVSPTGDDSDGLTWATAKRTVQGGISAAAQHGGEVWVAEALYRERIVLPAFVYLYGGFAGHETDRQGRDPVAHPSILDGDAVPRVVYVRNAGHHLATLDGFVVQNGGFYTAGTTNGLLGKPGGRGGGVYVRVSSPIIANNLIRTNSLGNPYDNGEECYGAGIYCYLSHGEIVGNTFLENEVLNTFDGAGGGIYCRESSLHINGNIFRQNHAHEGSVIFADYSSPWIEGNLMENNSFYNTYPLPLYFGSAQGAVTLWLCPDFLIEGNSVIGHIAAQGAGLSVATSFGGMVRNNLILNNRSFDPTVGSAGWGGGIYCSITQSATNTTQIVNNTFVGNTASASFVGEQGGAIAMVLLSSNLVFANNIVASNSSGIWFHPGSLAHPLLHRNCMANSNNANYVNLSPGPDDLFLDPRFMSPAKGNYGLQGDSPCVDAGWSGSIPSRDRDGLPRPLDGNHDGTALVDIGAYEYLDRLADTDQDGMPDGWETDHGQNLVLNDAELDPDGDGADNSGEYTAGTDPRDPNSVLRLLLEQNLPEPGIRLRWSSVLGRTYQIEYSSQLAPHADWQALTNAIAGTGNLLICPDPDLPTGTRFYRMEVTRD